MLEFEPHFSYGHEDSLEVQMQMNAVSDKLHDKPLCRPSDKDVHYMQAVISVLHLFGRDSFV
jgi:hypothetical protein